MVLKCTRLHHFQRLIQLRCKKEKYKQERKGANYKMQKQTSDKGHKHTNNLYSTKIYNVVYGALGPNEAGVHFLRE